MIKTGASKSTDYKFVTFMPVVKKIYTNQIYLVVLVERAKKMSPRCLSFGIINVTSHQMNCKCSITTKGKC